MQDSLGNTPLNPAMDGSLELVECLLQKGARVDIKNGEGTSQLEFVMTGGYGPQMRELFLKYCSETVLAEETKVLDDLTPLQGAIWAGQEATMYSLLNLFANIDPNRCFNQLIELYSREKEKRDSGALSPEEQGLCQRNLDLCIQGYHFFADLVREKTIAKVKEEMSCVAFSDEELRAHPEASTLNLDNLPIEKLRDEIGQARIEDALRNLIPPLEKPDNDDCADGEVSSKRRSDVVADPAVRPSHTKRARQDEAD